MGKSITLHWSKVMECVNEKKNRKQINNQQFSPKHIDYHEIFWSEKSIEPTIRSGFRKLCSIQKTCAPLSCAPYVWGCSLFTAIDASIYFFSGFESFIFVAKAILLHIICAVLNCCCLPMQFVAVYVWAFFSNDVLCLFKSLTKSMPLDSLCSLDTIINFCCFFHSALFSFIPVHFDGTKLKTNRNCFTICSQ